ncbi:hypothetical protein EMIHUDRAFT_230093 [Emiliania huxleyi CCMP1516]|uniref:RRM domain-containing protein n=2 Tax=Emiliania huxleyi TaxID=2903 RepID=A0A0D3KB11_EMIH1|nr:hypothetical protein EMIHUDRAFT_220404 [Emiliania huxleyi CCMP1516]XP_005785375.1 hypothetical protein EMIHUDRAFT_230093 [Emiliania huxleyi CCMP1516]EOD04962.1 hypothetical protein EMIHUDRAFT_220404 [Emiliania huxleyi CCMP1516]EOD32946.1 hypothetical protein EMIHUDRAFT_230093 [Emiliania huxleyi CCMP1516]|eukprot:XP_005757391.1 hypothetical protein EMIHUDRAFT_220404 [Emiliania huxleyi CCMP1516]
MEYQLHASTPQAAGGVRTICVHGLPNDVRLRELRNLAVLLPGYESCHLAPGDGRRLVTGFVRFDSPTSAAHACERLQGLQFDEEMPHMRPLAVEIARRDLDDDRGGSSRRDAAPAYAAFTSYAARSRGSDDTLCLRRLPEWVGEDSLAGLVSNLPGYRHLKLLPTNGTKTLFVLFESASLAAAGLEALRGREVCGSGGQPHRVEVEIARRSLQLSPPRD